MPNFHIPNSVREQIERAANKLANKVTEHIQADFPLTHEQIQDMLLPRETVTVMQGLVDEGVATIRTYEHTGLVFFRGEHLPDLQRGCVVSIWTPKFWFSRKDYSYSYDEPNFETGTHGTRFTADVAHLDEDTKDKLTTWLNQNVKQHRLQTLTSKIVQQIIRDVGPGAPGVLMPVVPSVAHLRQLWPNLLTLVDAKASEGAWGRRKKQALAHWREKTREETKRIKPYLPKPEVLAAYGDFIKVADVVLLQGSMLPEFVPDRTNLMAHVDTWQMFPRDPWCTRGNP